MTVILFTSCKPENNIEELGNTIRLKNDYAEKIIDIGGILIGVIIGGLITLGVNLKIQRRYNAIMYAQKNREQIYEPLYDEIITKLRQFKIYSNPAGPYNYLRTWNEFTESVKFRIPIQLKRLIEQFEINAKKYPFKYDRATDSLKLQIEKEIKEIIKENNIQVINDNYYYSEKINLVLILYKNDLLAGELLNTERNFTLMGDILIGNILFKEINYKFEDFYERINPKINTIDSIMLLRKETSNMIEIAMKLEKYLKNKIEYTLKIYKGRLSKI